MMKKFLLACGLSYAAMFVGPTHAANRVPLFHCGIDGRVNAVPSVNINSGLLPAKTPLDFLVYNFDIAAGPRVEMNETEPCIPESAKMTLLGVGLVCLALSRRKTPKRKNSSARDADAHR